MRKSEPSASIEGVIAGLRRATALQTALVDRASGARAAGAVAIDAFAAREEDFMTLPATTRPSAIDTTDADCEISRDNRGGDR
jgi:hypothetical protein